MNVVTISVDDVKLFGQVVRNFQEEGLAFHVETTTSNFVITVTGY